MAKINLAGTTLPSLGGTELALDDYRERTSLLVLGNQRTGKQLSGLIERLLAETDGDVPILQVAHLRGVPRMLHWIAERDIRKAVEALREGRSAFLLPIGLDWNGAVTSRFGFSARSSEPVVALVDERLDTAALDPDAPLPAALTKEHV